MIHTCLVFRVLESCFSKEPTRLKKQLMMQEPRKSEHFQPLDPENPEPITPEACRTPKPIANQRPDRVGSLS